MNKIARRQLLKGTAIAGAGFALPLKFLVPRAYPFAQSPTGIRKFVTTLPGLGPSGVNNFGQYIPLANRFSTRFAGLTTDTYTIGVSDFEEPMHPDLNGKSDDLDEPEDFRQRVECRLDPGLKKPRATFKMNR